MTAPKGITVSVDPLLDEEGVTLARESALEAAYENTIAIAREAGFTANDDEFFELYRILQANYAEATEHSMFYVSIGLATVKSLLDTDMLQLRAWALPDETQEEAVSSCLKSLGIRVAAALIHAQCVGEELRIPDSEFPLVPVEDRSIEFHFAEVNLVEADSEN